MAAERVDSKSTQSNHARIIDQVMSSDINLGSAIGAAYENGIDAKALLDQLNARASRIDEDLKRICNRNYQGFVESVQELLSVGEHADDLKLAARECSEGLQDAGEHLRQHNERLLAMRRQHRNVLAGLEALHVCRPAIVLYNQAQQQLREGRAYAALKTLQELEAEQLPRLTSYKFVETIRTEIPALRLQVKRDSMTSLRDFLASLRQSCEPLGAQAMTASQSGSNSGTPRRATQQSIEGTELDFSPLYRCAHICKVLDVMEECAEYYREERRKQLDLVLNPTTSLTSETTFRAYFHAVAGCFIAEHTVLATTDGLISRQWLDSLWQTALTQLSQVTQAQLAQCTTASMIRQVKDMIVTFNRTMLAHEYSVSRLTDVLLQVRSRYQAVLVTISTEAFKAILAEDNYNPLRLDNADQYRELLETYPFEDGATVGATVFPRQLLFSNAVPRLYAEVRHYIDLSHQFLENVGLSSTEVDELLRQSTNHLFSKVLSSILMKLVRSAGLNVQQLTQISLNTTQLELACESLELYISQLTRSIGNDVHGTRLHGADTLKDPRSAAEDGIFACLQGRIDQFLELAEFDWAPSAPKTTPSPHMFELLAYLTTTFAALRHMPTEVARAAYFNTCKYIGQRLISQVEDPEIKKINLNGIKSFEVDVATCEEYADTCPVIEAGDQLLKGAFVQLRELVDVFLRNDWDKFCDPLMRRKYYPHLKTATAITWLEKFEDKAQSSIFGRRSEKKSREVEAVLRQLKAQ
ncbi:uncharacterized protein MONBRDRAFT_27374 [Monosiga brevicollis MX1]|uniref:Exocyst complex component n=1 Tax=Monosiga brevicollis TaxID=81824 RepID=A9V537_MONBE|nr:uncharacterized protein MONBRDRAFT_27374 [Monosiga brevicollis MX1]EDQ87312.1 predicted protein [Monosiga brevicollis MX1]|eukprot:XP_001747925.1 hypothetical protein [Monosiga brevicollis MX1]